MSPVLYNFRMALEETRFKIVASFETPSGYMKETFGWFEVTAGQRASLRRLGL